MELLIGDMLTVPGSLGKTHFGTYLGRVADKVRGVVHALPETWVVLTELEEFAQGRPVSIQPRVAPNRWALSHAAQRASELVGRRYDLLTFNCEHVATHAQTGEARSRQVEGGLILAGLLLLVTLDAR